MRAITCSAAEPFMAPRRLLVVILTSSGRSGRSAPSAMACPGFKEPMYAAKLRRFSNTARWPVPSDMMQAEPSLCSVSAAVRLMRFVSAPSLLHRLVSSIIGDTPPGRSR